MSYLKGLTADELRRTLERVEGKQATLRVVAAIAYKTGLPQTTIAELCGVHRNTVRNWLERLERLETAPLEEVVYDRPRPGRPPELSDRERQRFESALRRPPHAVGFDGSVWTVALARQYLRDASGVDYSKRHVRRLLDEAEVGVDEPTRVE